MQVSADLISRVTDEVVSELKAWQGRALEPMYMVVYLGVMVVYIRDKGVVQLAPSPRRRSCRLPWELETCTSFDRQDILWATK